MACLGGPIKDGKHIGKKDTKMFEERKRPLLFLGV
jgi:hypothetical protein